MRKWLLWFLSLIILVVATILFYFWSDSFDPYRWELDTPVPQFEKVALDFVHAFDGDRSLPLMGSTLIDINKDGVDEVFIGGGMGQDDMLFQWPTEATKIMHFQPTSPSLEVYDKSFYPKREVLSTLSASSVDLDDNGWEDLIVGRENGLTVYYNKSGLLIDWIVLDLEFNENTSPLWLTRWDIDKDGDLDLFVAWYIKKELMDGLTNFSSDYGGYSELFRNDGDNVFTNITDEAWLRYQHNTFQWVFVDLNDDQWLDLVVAYDTGEPRIYKNNGDLTFELMKNPHSDRYSYPMGIGIGDYNNDGMTDVFFSNVGSTIPKSVGKGNIEDTSLLDFEWFLLENQWDFVFEEVADKTKVADYEFSWGAVMADMNNDGRQDLLVAENYVDLPQQAIFKLPGRMLIQNSKGEFVSTEKQSGVRNFHFGITPLVSDFNQDGLLDIVWINIDGPAQAFVSKPETSRNHYLKLQMPSDAKHIGAKIIIESNNQKKLEDYITWEWLASDQSSTIVFWYNFETLTSIEILFVDWSNYVLTGDDLIYDLHCGKKQIAYPYKIARPGMLTGCWDI